VDATWLIVGALAGLAVGAAVAWRVRSSSVARADEASRSAGLAIEESRAVAAEALRVQDLTLGSMQEGVLLLDGQGITAFGNEAVTRHLGRRPEGASQLYPPSISEMVERVTADRQPHSIETETGAPARWLRFTATPVGTDGSVLLVVTDVSETRRMEAIRKDFVANASHELKTPAASIQAGAETLRHAAHDDPEAIPRFAAQVERDAMRLSRIVADLLDLSRLESESALDERVPLDALVREEGQRCENAARQAGLELEVDAPQPAIVVGSSRDLSLLIRNLIDNAIRYTAPTGRVDVRVAPTAAEVVLTVEDTGAGIPSRELPRVFERFYRVDRARSRETGGTGLGLAIVKHVAENHGGHVEVRSELGRGSIFEVHLPAAYPAGP
jgi:signal transduction histidine kinase